MWRQIVTNLGFIEEIMRWSYKKLPSFSTFPVGFRFLMIYPLDQLKPKTKTNFFVNKILTIFPIQDV